MSYSEFTLEELKTRFNLTFQEGEIFTDVVAVNPSPLLRETLDENISLALGIDTEKARSEMIVVPILIELRKLFKHQISLFSGRDFNVEPSQGLNGYCDFIISHSPEQLSINAPVATLVEAKNDNIRSGIPQCIAEMVAAQIFNSQKQNGICCIYGAVTTGSNWKFLKLENNIAYIELEEKYINQIDLILGILSAMIRNSRHN